MSNRPTNKDNDTTKPSKLLSYMKEKLSQNETQSNIAETSPKAIKDIVDVEALWQLIWHRGILRLGPLLQSLAHKSWKSAQRDIWTKGLMIILATGIWFLVRTPSQNIVERTFFIPINATGLGETMISRDFSKQVTIRVQGVDDVLSTVDSTDFHAFINLHGLDGSYTEPVHVTPPEGVRIIMQEPSKTRGTVEILQYRNFTVDAIVIGQEDGELTRAFVTPSDVTALAAESDMAKVDVVSVFVGENTTALYPQALDAQGNVVTGIHFSPTQVDARLQKEVILMMKRIPVALELDHLPSHLMVAYQHISANDIQLGARYEDARARLHALEALTLTVDIAGYTEGLHTSIPIELELPEGVILLGKPLTLDLELVDTRPMPITPAPAQPIPETDMMDSSEG